MTSCKDGKETNGNHPAYNNPAVLPFTEALLQNPNDATLYYKRSIVLSQINMDSLALIDLNKAIDLDKNNVSYYVGKGEVLNYLNLHDEAIMAFSKAQELEPKDLRIKINIIKSLILADKLESAKAKTNNIIATVPDYPDAYYWQSQIAAKEKDTALAIQLVQQALRMDPYFYEASLLLGDYYAYTKNRQAIGQYQYTYQIDTTDIYPLFQIGNYYELILKNDSAKAAYAYALSLDPDFTDAYVQIGDILLKEDSITKAKRIFDLAIKTEPSNAYAYAQMGYCYEQLQIIDSAKLYYANALNLNRQNNIAKEGLKRISKK